MFKRFVKSAFAARLASKAIELYMRFVYATSKWRYVHLERLHELEKEGKGVIMAFWHGRIMMMGPARHMTTNPFYMLISTHRDGEIIANAVQSFGVNFIRGSAANPKKQNKNKSGAPAITQMIAALEEGATVGLTPDGPRGPGERAKLGVVRLAHMAGVPILPVAYAVSRGKRLQSWDKFLLAGPFSRGYYVVGSPIDVPAQTGPGGFEEFRLEVDRGLIAVTEEADALASGRAVMKPVKESTC